MHGIEISQTEHFSAVSYRVVSVNVPIRSLPVCSFLFRDFCHIFSDLTRLHDSVFVCITITNISSEFEFFPMVVSIMVSGSDFTGVLSVSG